MDKKTEKIFIYLTAEEKEAVREKARKAGFKSMNAYIRSKCFSNSGERFLGLLGLENFEDVLVSPYDLKHVVTTKLTEEEFNYLQNVTSKSRMSIASYLRRAILQSYLGKIVLNIETDDINALTQTLHDLNIKLEGFYYSFKYRTELCREDVEHIKELLTEVNQEILKHTKKTRNDREWVRKQCLMHLKEQINKVLFANTYPKCNEE